MGTANSHVGREADFALDAMGMLERGRHGNDGYEGTVRLILAVLLLSGCAVLGDRRTAAACQLADGATTHYALKHGATEANPFFKNASPNAVLFIKAIYAALVYWAFPENPSKGQRLALGTISVLGCGAAVHNYGVIRRMND